MVLAGQRPDIIAEICSRALSFWTYQVTPTDALMITTTEDSMHFRHIKKEPFRSTVPQRLVRRYSNWRVTMNNSSQEHRQNSPVVMIVSTFLSNYLIDLILCLAVKTQTECKFVAEGIVYVLY